MKKLYSLLACLIIYGSLSAQEKNKHWEVEAGINYVNVFPVGEDAPQGDYFEEFFNVNDHWNLGTYIAVSKNFTDRLSLTVKGSFNTISKWGEFGNSDPSVLVDNLKYFGLDGMINFKILKDTRIKPYLAVGGGYTWIEEGLYNTYSLNEGSNNLVGAGTINGAVGLTCDITDRFGINVQTAYKHSFKEYLTKHWQHSLGVVYKFKKKEQTENDEKPMIDSDGDGIIDEYDMCPKLYGLKAFAGCPDTDGDNIPDHLDDCPDTKSSGKGCPEEKQTQATQTSPNQNNNENTPVITVSKPTSMTKSVYFEHTEARLDNNAKQILNEVVNFIENNSDYTIQVEGHTDNTGTVEFNKNLSFNRANNVKQYLIAKGITANSIAISSYGESRPAANNTTEEGRALNRRVELLIKIIKKK